MSVHHGVNVLLSRTDAATVASRYVCVRTRPFVAISPGYTGFEIRDLFLSQGVGGFSAESFLCWNVLGVFWSVSEKCFGMFFGGFYMNLLLLLSF